jgi:hypothetical protein
MYTYRTKSSQAPSSIKHPPPNLIFHLSPIAYILVYNLTNPSAPTKSPSLINFAISRFNGLSASPPALRSCCTASSELTSPYAGVQEVFSRSRQISPVVKETFGWQQGVWKVILGGLLGYVGGRERWRVKVPPVIRNGMSDLLNKKKSWL